MNRREWMVGAFAWQHPHGANTATKLEYFSTEQAAEVDALCAQIIPSSDGTPGAREAGAVYFIDRALAGWDRDKRDLYRTGLAETQTLRRRLFPDSVSISALPAEQAIALLQAIENSPFFELLRTHTVLGFVGPPSRGGNRDHKGWALIQVEDRMSFEPPFGFYDAER
ncbi:MAG: gluconate 2-dehydrogenase subunit 3 family protein [Bryobacterales bacterium]|nr:gluconate 2-dehydrogenase subunit 3 family protein [Bryobacterales bacterium]